MSRFDVCALGELLIDFTENGTSPRGNPIMEANPGGAPCNVLAMLNKLGYKTTFIGKIGDDIFGRQLKRAVEEVGINTDGIWYQAKNGDFRLYHDENEGGELGQWKNDHQDCEFLAYSDGQYWYKEKGKFHPVARGFYSYERIKAREEWNEADFDFAIGSQIIVEWDPEEGFITYETRSQE